MRNDRSNLIAVVLSYIAATVFSAIILSGCANKTPHVSEAEKDMQRRYELALSNEEPIYQKTAAANQLNFERRKDLELKKDLQSLEIQSRLDAIKWTDVAILNERDRLHKLHDDAIAGYKASQQKNDDLRAKNKAVNVESARQIGKALNPPKTVGPSAEIVDDEKPVQPPPLIQP